MSKRNETRKRLEKLKSLWARGESLLIVMQNNPDPDAIAAACALRELANRTAGLNCRFAYGGTIGRAENRELVHYLGFAFYPFDRNQVIRNPTLSRLLILSRRPEIIRCPKAFSRISSSTIIPR